jgi:predicted GNAT family acetyltransferase
MRAEREPDLATFIRRAGGLLAGDPVLHTVICVVVEVGARQPDLFPGAAWITVADGDQVVGAAIRTPPFPVALTPMPDPALDALADLVAAELPDAAGVTGPRPYADRLATRWQARTGKAVREGRAMRLFRLDQAIPPASAPGRLRNAADLPERHGLFADWALAFARAVGEPVAERSDVVPRLRRLIDRGGLWVWCADGEPVGCASISLPASGAARIAMVYTPPELRGRGYASNCVAAASQRVLDAGLTPVLFTDLANPTSNKIYQRMGYRAVADAAEYHFSPARPPAAGTPAARIPAAATPARPDAAGPGATEPHASGPHARGPDATRPGAAVPAGLPHPAHAQ